VHINPGAAPEQAIDKAVTGGTAPSWKVEPVAVTVTGFLLVHDSR
jgi:hypothetical protein